MSAAQPAPGGQRDDWTAPGAYPVATGIHRIPLPLPGDALRAVNVYAVEADDGLVLVDGGWTLAQSRAQLVSSLAEFGAALGDIRRFLVTHAHRDHYSQALAIGRELGVPVALGAGERPSMRTLVEDEVSFAPQVERLRVCGADAVIALMRDAGVLGSHRDPGYDYPDEWLDGTTEIDLGVRTLQAVPTPGHTQGHLVFVADSDGALLAGDHVLPHITPSIGFEPAASRLPLRDFLQSLRLVREMPDRMLLPAHGPVTASVHARVDELVAHHDARLQSCLDAVAAGATTAYEVARRLTWTRHERRLTDLDWFNQMLAVIETGAHLDLLRMQERLPATEADGVLRYSTPR